MAVFESFSTGGMTLRNRMVMPPMNTDLATEDGEVTDQLINHYSIRAPWLGLIIVRSGYDVIEIHGAHGYLLNQFASALKNIGPIVTAEA